MNEKQERLICNNCHSVQDAIEILTSTYEKVMRGDSLLDEGSAQTSNQSYEEENEKRQFPVVGRSEAIDLSKYTTTVHGREVIDFEKLESEDPGLYSVLLHNEHERDRLQEIEYQYDIDSYSILKYAKCPNCETVDTLVRFVTA